MKSRILIVEDHAPLRAGLLMFVESIGHDAITAATVSEAMEKLEQSPTHVLLDINLPDGEGTTVLHFIRANALPIKVAVLSGSLEENLLKEANSLCPDTIFQKPPEWDAVMAWLST